ncbi:Threonyl-tRNA synthetase [Candidatus Johnevansia muelleri]|uniref:Threonine--tRNA ligase n=1 Tax=Candidatus Johnevansia muelleri TaxID=1495769 RepID=A0A078KB95_9GAMM|nr:Threonyl-tRNA synthetase [Candidatus Evansia muelleri]
MFTIYESSIRTFYAPTKIRKIVQYIDIKNSVIAVNIDGMLVDTEYIVNSDSAISIVTIKDIEGINIVRKSCAHILGNAVKHIYPDAKLAICKFIDNGFYYDIDFSKPINLKAIEHRMNKLIDQDYKIIRLYLDHEEAIRIFIERNEPYKQEIINCIPEYENVILYYYNDYIDLCRGPNIQSTININAFKLLNLSGAYWHGNSKSTMLTRIFGTAWQEKQAMNIYINGLKEAKKRDHRKIASKLDLLHIQKEAPGMIFWHYRGWTIWQVIEKYMRNVYKRCEYYEIRCPQIMDVSIWKNSGHWENYYENMFFTESEKREYAIKPMNCPNHIQIFNSGLYSYRMLPIRYGEFGSCHRNELSGALHGLMRTRAFTQDDGHIFCLYEHLEYEIIAFHNQSIKVYNDFGFNDIDVKIALRPNKRIGKEADWDIAEEVLRCALYKSKVQWKEHPGDGAFYGPKIEYHIKDSIGRSWQLGTIQVDFIMPNRLGAQYIDKYGLKSVPVMLHRAIIGSFERFIGILIEHYAGNLPIWLSPLQAVVMNITNAHNNYTKKLLKKIENCGVRIKSDLRNEKIGFKIREHTLKKVPYILIVGDKEVEFGNISVRLRGNNLGTIHVNEFINFIINECAVLSY